MWIPFFCRRMAGSLFPESSISPEQLLSFRTFSSQLFVSRLPFYIKDKELKEAFSPFGKVTEARLVMDHKTKRHKGFGFVTYDSEVDAQKAIKAMNNRIFCGCLIFVEVANPKSVEEAP